MSLPPPAHPRPVQPWNICRFLGLDALLSDTTEKEDLVEVISKCLQECKQYEWTELTNTEKCLKEEMGKPLQSK